ncbi:MAG: efflux RND transporter permease subunit, partial [Parvibaculaceae bacterium]
MTLSELSIRRPVLAAVASLIVIVFGIASVFRIPVRELPDIDTAVISITTVYTGAAPQTIDSDITEIIDGAVAGISGVKSISSESRLGQSRTTVEFVTSKNIDEAANDVRDAIGRVRGDLPEDVEEPRIVKQDADADPVIRLAVTSDRMSPSEITDYLERNVNDRLTTIDGVASVDIFGERRYAIRVWLDRRALAARNLTVADVEAALGRANLELPAGDLESINRGLTVKLNSRLTDIEQFKNIVVDRMAGYPVKLADVARVEMGVEDDNTLVRANGKAAVGLGIIRQSQANTIAVSNAVRAQLAEITPNLPEGMTIEIGGDEAQFVAASVKEVLIALGVALVLVVLVILLFLRSWRATLIPAIAIPISLIGTFTLIYALGFSLNILTLMALVLAIGLVVDDAIVMLENIERRISLGEKPLVASVLGARQVTFAIIATSLTLCAVFLPISMLEGDIGKLFVEFGVVMAASVLISTYVSLSACPALASKILKSGAHNPDAAAGGRLGRAYRGLLVRLLDLPVVVIGVTVVIAGLAYVVFQNLPQELTPREDRGSLFIPLTTPQGSTVDYTDRQTKLLEDRIRPYAEEADIVMIYSVVGSQQRANRSFVVVRMKPWNERDGDQGVVVRRLVQSVNEVVGARGAPTVPAGLGLRGSSTPLRVVVSGPDFEDVKQWANTMLARAQDNPGLLNPELDFEENQPQLTLEIDRDRANDLGVSVQTIASTLQTMFASREVTTYIDRGREYSVMVQAEDDDRQTPSDIDNVFVRAGDGKTLVPLSSLVKPTEEAAAPALRRYNRLPSITLTAALSDDYPLGQAIAFAEETARTELPPQATIQFAGQSQQFKEASSGMAFTFVLALLVVFLVLAAQFESWVHPIIIMLGVPMALAGAVFTLLFTGLTLNLYTQIGVILLIGLMAKNGILIAEFANQLRDEGKSVREAVIEASVVRLRPILMTVIATILGAVPLVMAHGAGAESRYAIGTVIVGGLGFATVLTL